MTILDKLMEKKDLSIFIKARKAHLKEQMILNIKSQPENRKEMIKQRFIGRVRELMYLKKLLEEDRLKEKSKAFWIHINDEEEL